MKFENILHIFFNLCCILIVANLIFTFFKYKKIAKENGYDLKFYGFKGAIIKIMVFLSLIFAFFLIFSLATKGSSVVTATSPLLFLPTFLITNYNSRMFKFDETTIKYINKTYNLDDISFKNISNGWYYDCIPVSATIKKPLQAHPKFVAQFTISLRKKEYIRLSQFTKIQSNLKTLSKKEYK